MSLGKVLTLDRVELIRFREEIDSNKKYASLLLPSLLLLCILLVLHPSADVHPSGTASFCCHPFCCCASLLLLSVLSRCGCGS